MTAEDARLAEAGAGTAPWRLWGPYLSERQWGTVREDYSADGTAWDSFPHEHARSRAYRWGEDGIAGLSDDRQLLCFALALWNGRDPILKERLFGLTNGEGNHGEDVKEVYHYLDATPTHSYLRMLYRYPQAAFPYEALVRENAARRAHATEYELADTGVLDGGVFDVAVEYAKAGVADIAIAITVRNTGAEPATVHLLPQLWFRNVWSWKAGVVPVRPQIAVDGPGLAARHPWLGDYRLLCDGAPAFLLTENDTNVARLYGIAAAGPFKDAFHEAVVSGRTEALAAPGRSGTKAAAHYVLDVPPGEVAVIRLRLQRRDGDGAGAVGDLAEVDRIVALRRAEADAFYAARQAHLAHDPEAQAIHRQALAGMIWSKQVFRYDVRVWLEGDPLQPAPPARRSRRNVAWEHFNSTDILSMPDKWEYPWFAAWDLAFHCLPLATIDPEFAKSQLLTLTREWYMHPNGQLPAYEWAFDDVNPPVHAWATWRVFEIDRAARGGVGDVAFLERVFHKLMLNFTWWVNRKDADDRSVFQGGFLGLDNVGLFDRSNPPAGGGRINQADGTAWMAMYALNMMRIAIELALHNTVYEDIATKFFEHFLRIAQAMTDMAGEGYGLWDDEDGFFYDEIDLPNRRMVPLRIRSMVGLIPLFAVEVIEHEDLERLPEFARRMRWVYKHRPELAALVSRWRDKGERERHLLSLLRGSRMKRLLRRMLDEAEFLSPYGVRSMSRIHLDQPFVLEGLGDQPLTARYQAGNSDTNLFGGNSNWRGPVWFPVNFLAIEALRRFDAYYGPDFRVEHPVASGRFLSLAEVADDLSARLVALFRLDPHGRRPADGAVAAGSALTFYEFFDGDTGRGLGASHQTGWTGLVASLLVEGRPPPASDA